MEREIISPEKATEIIQLRRDNYPCEKIEKLNSNIALPSYVHGYSLAIEYMKDWFLKKFEKNYFNDVYIDGRHVLDDYKTFNSKEKVKRINPRVRIEPRVEFDYDREMLDTYMAPPDLYIRKSSFNESFFKDYDRDMFLGMQMKALRMTFNYKVRVNTRSQQLDIYNRILMYFRIGSTMHEDLSIDFHVPKSIMLNIADRAGFEIKNNEIIDIISFLEYINSHSELPFLFKIRAINQKAEFFIRLNGLYTHISCVDKPQLDDGERDGKLDFNFHVELSAVLTIPIPHFYAFYTASELTTGIEVKEANANCIAIYSINANDIPKEDEHGWYQGAITEYMTEKGDTEMDLSSIFTGDNSLARAINHDLTRGVSPAHFVNVVVYHNNDIARLCPIDMDWDTKIAKFIYPQDEELLHVAIYYDRKYINELDIELNKYNKSRINQK